MIAEESAKLDIKPHTMDSTTDKAMSATQALRGGDYRAAEALAQRVLAQSKLESFTFHPFDRFINELSEGNDPRFLAGLDAWISHKPKSALAYLIRARYYADTAWLVRGSDFSLAVPAEHMQRFDELLHRAEADTRKALALDPKIPYGHFMLLRISGGEDDFKQMETAFRGAIARFPGYYELYRIRLHYLQPKWGGSVEDMYQFVGQYAGSAPGSSPLKLLYLQLTANLLNAGWVECRNLAHERLTACIDAYMTRSVTAAATEGVSRALAVYKHADAAQFSVALWPILGDMIGTPGNSTTVNTILQLAGDAMGSENQLIHEPGHNNYVLDDIAARVWAKLGYPDNVEQKFHEALADAGHMSFANEEDRETAIAAIYDDMARNARDSAQYAKMIAYYDAANAVAGVNHGGTSVLKCFGYFKLQHFQEAVEECTRQIDAQRDVADALYNRARSYEGLKDYTAALADFTAIAANGSSNYIRDGAVIEMDHINALLGKYSDELAIFDKYPFVFDGKLQSSGDLAVAYNNRCFANMKLGKLDQALADCTMSLKYGRLPDALQKQQQLQRQLSARAGAG